MNGVLPDELVTRWQALDLPIPTGESDEAGVVGFRVNTLKTDVATALAELVDLGVDASAVAWSDVTFTAPLSQREALVRSDAAERGDIYVQALSSQMAGVALGAKPGEEVLDLCAAPGGKTLMVAQAMGPDAGGGRLAAVEAVKPRFFKLKANLARGGAPWVKTYLADGRGIGRKTPGRFDRVLLDAPCSSEAQICPSRPESYQYWSLKKVRECARKQKKLLASALRATKVGGCVLYCTCTSAPEENEAVLQDAMRRMPGAFVVEDIAWPGGTPASLRPGLASWDGTDFDPTLRRTLRVCPYRGSELFFLAFLRVTQDLGSL